MQQLLAKQHPIIVKARKDLILSTNQNKLNKCVQLMDKAEIILELHQQ